MPIEPPATGWVFPDVADLPSDGGSDDLVGVGADLEPGTLLAAYRQGLFPMPSDDPGVGMLWWSPVERGVLPLDGLRVSRSLRQAVRRMEVRVDTAFHEVVRCCADPARDGAWIDDEIVAAYTRLHELGWAHSVEAWQDGELVGGLYGVAVGGLFAGESMFHRVRDASKVALVGLVDLLRDEYAERRVLDVQWRTEHLATLGVVTVPRPAYVAMLERAVGVPLPKAFLDPGLSPGRARALVRVEPGQTTCGGAPVSLTIGRPAPSQSSIPPSRFTTSCPCWRRYIAACAERPPTLHTMSVCPAGTSDRRAGRSRSGMCVAPST